MDLIKAMEVALVLVQLLLIILLILIVVGVIILLVTIAFNLDLLGVYHALVAEN